MTATIVKRASAVALVLLASAMSSCAMSTAKSEGHAAGMPVVMVRGTGDLGLVIERADGAIVVVENTGRTALCRVDGLGDLSHASAVISRDARYAFVFGRDGGLSKIDLLGCRIVKRIIQAGNAIGGAISQDGRVVAVSNYEPGGVKLFDTTPDQLAELSARSSPAPTARPSVSSTRPAGASWLRCTMRARSGSSTRPMRAIRRCAVITTSASCPTTRS
jgi:protein NirF